MDNVILGLCLMWFVCIVFLLGVLFYESVVQGNEIEFFRRRFKVFDRLFRRGGKENMPKVSG